MFTAFAERGGGPEIGTRVGFTTPRGLGNAVVRNRIRRRLREAVRLHLAELAPGWDVVFNPRPPVRQAPFEALETEVVRLFEKLK
jgi:ribonuclease P protein component